MWKIVVIVFVAMLGVGGCSQSPSPQIEFEENDSNKVQPEHPSHVYVDIKGAVVKPGVYKLSYGARVFEVLELAGGVKDGGCLNTINQAALIDDGMIITVPLQGEPTQPQTDDARININTADAGMLETLPDIGPATAANIIEYRREHGEFASSAAIMNVSGIGEATYASIQGLIRV